MNEDHTENSLDALRSLSDGKTLDENGTAERLTLVKNLGEGGMGVVWLARDSQLSRLVAIKRPKGAALATQIGRARFLREARTAAQLAHPNIVTIHQVGEDAQGPFIEMEYVEGYSLREEVKRTGNGLEVERVIEIGIQLCDALALAHQRGIIHRDIKPANILMTPRGLPKLGDFGLATAQEEALGEDRASMTGTGAMLGTLYYASPEQIKDAKQVDARSDIYSLGATLYFAAVGEDPRALYFRRLPEALRPILEKALEENPAARFTSMEEFGGALQSARVSAAPSSDQDARCPKCKSPNPLTARHCVSCGSSLADLFKKCPQCQTENRVDQKFCQSCGANLPALLEAEVARNEAARRLELEEEARKEAARELEEEARKEAARRLDLLEEKARKKGTQTIDLGGEVKMELVWIPAGSLQMGSPDSEKNHRSDESPVHTVELDGFWMGKYEVTQDQYEAVMGENPSWFGTGFLKRLKMAAPKNPVERVSWNDAADFCRKATAKVAQASSPASVGWTFRLPTEAEWEYACRAGSTTRFCFGDSDSNLGDYAWYRANSGSKTHPVGQKKPNAWDLYDMHGNVWEWCADWYGEKYHGGLYRKNPQGASSGGCRVLRGGSWINNPSFCRSAYRGGATPANTYTGNGFRVVCGGSFPR